MGVAAPAGRTSDGKTSRGRLLLFASITALLTLLVIEVILQVGYFLTAGDFLFRRTSSQYLGWTPHS